MSLLHEATERQVQAASPVATTWVAANAGSGKTRVLIDRVARLLLSGVEPQRILCLTYTKAAATEIIFEGADHGVEDGQPLNFSRSLPLANAAPRLPIDS